jgi:hypothetical protein
MSFSLVLSDTLLGGKDFVTSGTSPKGQRRIFVLDVAYFGVSGPDMTDERFVVDEGRLFVAQQAPLKHLDAMRLLHVPSKISGGLKGTLASRTSGKVVR